VGSVGIIISTYLPPFGDVLVLCNLKNSEAGPLAGARKSDDVSQRLYEGRAVILNFQTFHTSAKNRVVIHRLDRPTGEKQRNPVTNAVLAVNGPKRELGIGAMLRLFGRVLPIAFVVVAAILTTAWVGVIAYGLSKMF